MSTCVNSLDQCYYSKQDLVHVRPGLLMQWGLHGLLEQFSIIYWVLKIIWNIIHLLWFCSTAFCDCKYQTKTNHAFSWALNWLCVLALYPHWFIVLFVLVITGHCDDFALGFMAIIYDHSNSEVKFQRVGVLPAMENTTYIFFQWLVHLLQEWSTCNFSSLYQYQYRVKQTRNYLLSSNIRGGEESAMIDCCSDRKHSLK